MLRELAPRLLLVAAPFVIWFVWRAVALRTGRPMGSTPWTWLVAIAGVLLAVSLLTAGLFRGDNRGETYVPAEVEAGGHVAPGHFEKKAPAK
ncbi:MAG: DUF6111 family protein [Phenylobacterium sp.]